MDLNCILETTAGGNSENNGEVECSNRTNANMVRSALTTMKSIIILNGSNLQIEIEELWCFALQHCVFIQRRLYNQMRKDIPYFLVYGIRPTAKELVLFGSIVTLINPSKNLLPKLSNERATEVYFVGFSNHDSCRLVWIPGSPRKFYRARQCIIDDSKTFCLLQNQFSSPALPILTKLDETLASKLESMIVSPTQLDTTDQKFVPVDIKSFTVTLPPPGISIGLQLRDAFHSENTSSFTYLQVSTADLPSQCFHHLHQC
jgi:hypothetical protein